MARNALSSFRPARAAVAALAGLAIVAGLLGLAGPATAQVKVGVLMPLTGKGASYGAHQQVAVKMFQDHLEKAGPKAETLKLVIYDTRGENTEAINLTRKLIGSDRVVAVVGPLFSGESEVAFPVAVQGKTPIITPTSAKPGIAAANRPWAFRNALTSDKLDGALIDRWLAAHPTVKKVVILVDTKDAVSKSDGTIVLPAALKKRGITILDTISFQTGDIDYSAQVTRAKSLRPDGIVVAALYNEGANAVREARKQGLTQPIVAGLGVMDPRFIELAGPAAEGVMTVNDFWVDNPAPAVASWVSEYKQRSPTPPSNAAALMYDTLDIVRSCAEKSGLSGKPDDLDRDRERMRDCLAKIKDYPAPVTGPTTFNADGDALRQPVVLVVKNGKFESVR
ncbi:MAG: ABC transporter substrate-binding protein [Candidatus Limnocylindria bacterium]